LDAEIAQSKLHASGIEAQVESDDAGGGFPQLQPAGVFVLVRDADAKRAAAVLSQPELTMGDPRGDVDEAEAAAQKREPRGVVSYRTLRLSIVFFIGIIAGLLLSEFGAPQTPFLVSSDEKIVEVDRNLDGQSDAWFVYRGPDLVKSHADRNFDGKVDFWGFHHNGLLVRSELDQNFDGDADAWLTYEFGNVSTFQYDNDHNRVPDGTVEYRYDVPLYERFHPNGGRVERFSLYVDGDLREVYSVAADGSKTLLHSYDEVGHELGDPR